MAVLISGTGTNLQALIDATKQVRQEWRRAGVEEKMQMPYFLNCLFFLLLLLHSPTTLQRLCSSSQMWTASR